MATLIECKTECSSHNVFPPHGARRCWTPTEKVLSKTKNCCVHRWRDHPSLAKANRGKGRERQHSIKLSNPQSHICDIFRLFCKFRLPELVRPKPSPSLTAYVHLLHHLSPTIHPSRPPSLFFPSFLLPLFLTLCLPRRSTMAIMTH